MTSGIRICTTLLACWLVAACAVNPVTGERHLQFYDTAWENEVGSSLYEPLRQQQGGDFVLDPELATYVRSVGQRLAAHARRNDELGFEFRLINDSTPNAWALPGGKISINRGLLTELDSEAELAAVLGHEIVHADAAHAARQQSKGVLTQVGAMAGMVLIGSNVDSDVGQQAAVLLPSLGAQLLTQKYSRDAEREADLYGMRYMSEAGYDPDGAVGLQETFLRLSEGRNPDWLSGLFASHPPSRERVELNRATATELPDGGETGADRFQQHTAYLRRIQPAYEAYDQAMEHVRKEDFTAARQELDKALAIEPRESLFHALKGDLEAHGEDRRAALAAYDRAVELYDGFFYHHLRRGQLHLEEGRRAAARKDLERSLELLPTTLGHYLLGNLEREAGDVDQAVRHYRQAAQSDSETGRKAQRQLIRLDIGGNPQDYLASAPAADTQGETYCLIGNRTSVTLTGITVHARFLDDSGTTRERSRNYQDALEGNEQASVAMGWRTSDAAELDRRMACSVVQARVAED